jgi:hypothetical protein
VPIPAAMIKTYRCLVTQIGALIRALSSRQRIGDGDNAGVILPLRGGAGALVKRSAGRRLVTIASGADLQGSARGLTGWLERMQARRSAIVVVPDRPSGVVLALKLSLNPERLRLSGDFDVSAGDNAALGSGRRRPWHSRG